MCILRASLSCAKFHIIHYGNRNRPERSRYELRRGHDEKTIIGSSEEMVRVFKMVDKVADSGEQ